MEAQFNKRAKDLKMSNKFGLPFPLMANADVEAAARQLSNELVSKYHAQRAKTPHLNAICLDYIENYPEDDVLERASVLLNDRWSIDGREFKATSGRAGCIWMTPKFPIG